MVRTTIANPFTETATELRTLDDLRRFIRETEQADGSLPILFWMDTTYPDLEVEIKTQECREHNGHTHDQTGVIFQLS